MTRTFNFYTIISLIRNNEFISNIEKITVDEIAQRGLIVLSKIGSIIEKNGGGIKE